MAVNGVFDGAAAVSGADGAGPGFAGAGVGAGGYKNVVGDNTATDTDFGTGT